MRSLKPCGTRAAYQRHLKNGEPPCAACLAANNKANEDHRADHVIRREEDQRAGARVRAMRRLAQEYPDRYRELATEELSKLTFPNG